jgi:hypothetical protein
VGGSKEKTTQSQTMEVPAEIRARGSAITTGAMDQFGPNRQPYNYADYEQAGKDRTGQLNDFHTTGGDSVTSAQDSWKPYMADAANVTQGAFDTTRGPGYGASVQEFMNPYESGVIDNIDYNTDVSLNKFKDIKAKGGAFGNDRADIGTAELLGAGNREKNQLRYQGYGDAVAQHNTAFNQGITTADTLSKLGQDTQTAELRGAQAADQHGNLLTAQDQAEKDAAHNAYTEPLDFYERLAAINAMQPYNRTSTSTGTSSSSQSPWGTLLAAGGQAIAASDERLKEDISDVDPEHILGAFSELPSKAYRYTEEARNQFPDETADGARIGFMAQDLEKVFPEDVVEKDGFKMVDMPNVVGKLVVAIKGLEARTRKGE